MTQNRFPACLLSLMALLDNIKAKSDKPAT